MFKKLFGPKEIPAVGDPVPLDELRKIIFSFMPKDGEINQYLTFEDNKKFPQGFLAVWRFYAREKDSENFQYRNYAVTHTVNVDIDPDTKTVHLKAKHFMKTTRVPKDEPIYEPWYRQVRIGTLDEIREKIATETKKKVYSYSSRKSFESLAQAISQNGWTALT